MFVRVDGRLRFRDVAQGAHIGERFVAEPVRRVLASTCEIRQVHELGFPIGNEGVGADFVSSAGANETADARNVVRIEEINIVVGVVCCSEERTLGVVVGIKIAAEAELLKVIKASDTARFFLCLGQSRHQEARKDGNDGDNDQQLNERKSLSCPND
jgi:hypothetical protein